MKIDNKYINQKKIMIDDLVTKESFIFIKETNNSFQVLIEKKIYIPLKLEIHLSIIVQRTQISMKTMKVFLFSRI